MQKRQIICLTERFRLCFEAVLRDDWLCRIILPLYSFLILPCITRSEIEAPNEKRHQCQCQPVVRPRHESFVSMFGLGA